MYKRQTLGRLYLLRKHCVDTQKKGRFETSLFTLYSILQKKMLRVAGEPTENDFGFVVKMVLPMLSSLVLFMLIFICGQMVAQSIAQEKTSKAVSYTHLFLNSYNQ